MPSGAKIQTNCKLAKQISSAPGLKLSPNSAEPAYIQNELAKAAQMHNKAMKSFQSDSLQVRQSHLAQEAGVLNCLPRNIRLAFAYCRLAETYENFLQDLTKARFYYEAALAIFDRELGEDASESIKLLEHLASISETKKDDAQTESLYKRALVCAENSYGPDDIRTARILEELAQFYCSTKRWTAAEPLFKKAVAIVAIYDKEVEEGTLKSSAARDKLAELYITEDKPQSAEHLFKPAITGDSNFAGSKSLVVAGLYDRLGKLNLERSNFAEAEKDFARALRIKETSLGENCDYLLVSLDLLGQALAKQGKGEKAEEVSARAKKIRAALTI
jgi:tetratricopeptide (TPR) repeat protein